MTNLLARICADVGVEIIPGNGPRPVHGQTAAKATLHKILVERGEGHLIQLLRTFLETENDTMRMNSHALLAISDIMVAHPEWADSGLRWLEVFDRIDVAEIQRQAKANRHAVPQRHGIATMVFRELSAAFAQDHSASSGENIVPIDNDLLYGTKAIAGYLEISLQKCRDLIVTKAVPTFTMPGSTTRCARKSTLNAAWAAYEQQSAPQRALG
jgi:hypothetical protein